MVKIVVKYHPIPFLPPETDTNAFTVIYVETDEFCFPSNTWSDFTYTILQWWVTCMIDLKSRANATKELYFMDGDYRLDVYKDDKMGLVLKCINARGAREVVEASIECSYVEFMHALLRAVKDFLYVLHFECQNERAERSIQPVFSRLARTIKDIISDCESGIRE
jgi:hypothetical protein